MSGSAREHTKYTIYGYMETLEVDWPVEHEKEDTWFLAVRIKEEMAGLNRQDVGELIRVLALSLEKKT